MYRLCMWHTQTPCASALIRLDNLPSGSVWGWRLRVQGLPKKKNAAAAIAATAAVTTTSDTDTAAAVIAADT